MVKFDFRATTSNANTPPPGIVIKADEYLKFIQLREIRSVLVGKGL